MTTRNDDIVFMAEYIKNVLYFATVRNDKELKSTDETHFFCIDDELVYENYYSDFGPLNLGCVYRYCRILSEKFKTYLHKQTIVHYTSADPRRKANAAFLLGCYGVLYLSLSPKDALKPLLVRGASYRPFQDATLGDSNYTITILDCLKAIKKASNLGFFNFKDFDFDEYDKYDKLTGGDLNWIVPGKFLAFIGPVDSSYSYCHPPEMYIDYFLRNDVKVVIRLNKRFYDGNVFNNAGITHYDLFFADGSVPPRHILLRFLQISEDTSGALAVHCKAGLGRTGSLIGCYLIKHYRMTAHEAIGWMRICRPGSVIGQQQGWLEHVEPWLIKQGNLYRKRYFHDTEKIKVHEFGVYSISEKSVRRRAPPIFQKTLSPPPPLQRSIRSDVSSPPRPQASKFREDKEGTENEEKFLQSYDLTDKYKNKKTASLPQMRDDSITSSEANDNDIGENDNMPKWRQYLCCHSCKKRCKDVPAKIDREHSWRPSTPQSVDNKQRILYKSDNIERPSSSSRRSGAGEPRTVPPPSRSSSKYQSRSSAKSSYNELNVRNLGEFRPSSPMRTPNAPLIKTVNEARNVLMKSSQKDNRVNQLNTSITVTPHFAFRIPDYGTERKTPGNVSHMTPHSFSTVSQAPIQPQQRLRLGRSPSPPRNRVVEQSRATNTPTPSINVLTRDASKIALKEALSRLKVMTARDGSMGAASIGAASLGARREAPAPMRAPSVRSDERPLATQGDMLNSIKLQRRIRSTFEKEKLNKTFNEKFAPKEKPSLVTGTQRLSRSLLTKGRRNVQNPFH